VVASYALVGERVAGAVERGEDTEELAALLGALGAEMQAAIATAQAAQERAPVVRDETLPVPVLEEEARAITAAARLVRSGRAPRAWDLVAEDGTVIGHVSPARTGRGWEGWAAGTGQGSAWRTHRTRQTAGYDAGAAWVHLRTRQEG
jgi:hypothetical protein